MHGITRIRTRAALAALALSVAAGGWQENTPESKGAAQAATRSAAVVQVANTPPDKPKAEPAESTPYERHLLEQLAIVQQDAERLGELLEGLDEQVPGMAEFTAGLFSIDAELLADPEFGVAAVELRLRQFRETPTTPDDSAGLDHLASRRYAEAVAAFERSAAALEGRGLPYLFMGVAHLERGDWQSAAEALAHAVGEADCEPTAELLHAWASACAADPPADDAEAGLRYAEAFFALGGMPDDDNPMGLLFTNSLHFNESDALAWAEGALFNLRFGDVAELIDVYETTDDPRLAEAIAFGLLPRERPDTRLADLAQRFPDDPALALAVAWDGYMAMDPVTLELEWVQVQAVLEQAAQRDPGNGAYAFLSVFPYHVIDHRIYEEYERWEEDPRFHPGRPLTDPEIAVLRRAADHDRFEPPGAHLRAQAIGLRRQLYGGFASRIDVNTGVTQLGKLRELARRYPNTARRLAGQGRLDEALELGEMLVILADRYGGDRLLSRLVSNSILALFAREWGELAQDLDAPELARYALTRYLKTWRMSGAAGDLSMALLVPEVLPVMRLRSSADALVLTLGGDEGTMSFDAYLLGLRNDTDHPPEEMLERLDGFLHDVEDTRQSVGDYGQKAIMHLADLRDARALPALRELAAAEDTGLFTDALVQWALGRIEDAE
ncbi:MAG: hypothetical protein ACIAXF_05400 [Phycisphaerales bacterium JB063]